MPRNQRGESIVVIALVVAVAVIATFLLLGSCGRNHDGRKGLDWEKQPQAKHGLDWEKAPRG
jgi:hypothetical protein